MLIPEQEMLFRWLKEQPNGASLREMAEANAPGYTYERVMALKNDGLLTWEYGRIDSNGNLVAAYKLSDKALKELQLLDDKRDKESQDKRQQRFDNKIAIAQTVIPIITFVLGMLVEHFSGITAWVFSLFA